MMFRMYAVSLGLFLLAAPVASEVFHFSEGHVAYVSHGIQCSATEGEIVKDQATIDGEVIVHDDLPEAYDIVTNLVPATKGVSFTIRFRALQDIGEDYLIGMVLHPPMTPPDGREDLTLQWWGIPAMTTGGETALGYRIEDDFELVPGTWIFRLLDGEDILVQWPFKVVEGAEAEPLLTECARILDAS